jgi:hypothetical protein
MAAVFANIAKTALANPKVLETATSTAANLLGGITSKSPSVGTGTEIEAGAGPGAGASPARENLNSAFQTIYMIAMVLTIVIYLIIVILGIINLIMYISRQISQSIQTKKDKYLLNKNSNEFELLEYLSNNESNDPYYIYTQRSMIGLVYSIIGAIIIVFGIQIAIYLGLRIWSILKSTPYKDTLDIPYRVAGIFIFLFVIAFSMDAIYKSMFLKIFQNRLNEAQSTYTQTKRIFYTNVTDDVRFLNLLRSDDTKGLATYLKGVAATDDTASIARRFFTMSIYSYLRYEIPDTDPAHDEALKIFTRQNINSEDINPADFLFFNKANYVSNVYPIVREQLGLSTILGDNREYQVQVELNRMLRDFNRKINELSNIHKANSGLLNYIITMFFITLFACVILALFFVKEIGAIVNKFVEFIRNLRQ